MRRSFGRRQWAASWFRRCQCGAVNSTVADADLVALARAFLDPRRWLYTPPRPRNSADPAYEPARRITLAVVPRPVSLNEMSFSD